MEAAAALAERLMSQYEDRLPLKQICDEILVVLREGGVRIGDPVPADLAAEAEERLAVASMTSGAGGAAFIPVQRAPHPDRVKPRGAGRSTMPA
jgi:hypothetical protein